MALQPLTNKILVGLEAENPSGDPWIDITPGSAHAAFDQALAALPDQGGTLYVLPMESGTTEYTIGAEVLVSKPNVSLEFLGGSELSFPSAGSSPANMFLVRSEGFRCLGARVRLRIEDASNAPDRSFFRVEADDAQFLDCSFDVEQGVGSSSVEIESFSCIRVHSDSADPPDPIRRNFRVGRCTFELQPGVGQVQPWKDPGGVGALTEPLGVCCIRATRLQGCNLTENHFRSGSASALGDCGPAIYLLDVEECTISANTVRGLRTPPGGAAPDRGTLVRLRSDSREGHHSVISCNVMEDLETSHLLVLDGVRGINYDFVTGNVFDNARSRCFSVIHGNEGTVLGVVGNVISRVEPAAGAEGAVHLKDVRHVTISTNVFAGLPPGLKPIDLVGCANVMVSPHQASADSA